MRRKNIFLLATIFVFFAAGRAAALEGVLSGEKNLRVLETKWFDIIFPPASEATARLLSERADQMYEEVFAEFGAEPVSRMPITVTPAVETVNAYFSAAPYNFIVVYDSLPEIGQGESFAIFSENLLGIFRHEIVHAVTFELKNRGWQIVGKIFGDVINPAYLLATSGLAEGTSVVLESEGGEGRLNDSYSMHTVRQAKLEGQFPEWRDIQGASDLFPYGSYYQINGAFYKWLRDKHGTEKFAEMWYRCVNFKTISFGLMFKKLYGKSVQKMWRDFAAELQVPQATATQDFAEDAFNFARGKDSKKKSLENKSAARYGSLTSCAAGFACVDAASNTVLFFKKKSDGTLGKPKVLFHRLGVTKINFSSSGNLLAVSYVSLSDSTTRTQVAVYDLERGRFFDLEENGLRDAAVMVHEGQEYLACVKSVGQKSSIVFYKILRKKSSKKQAISEIRKLDSVGTQNGATENFEAGKNEIISNLVDCGCGRLGYILKSGSYWKIAVQDLSGKKILYELPKGLAIRSLSWVSAEDAVGDVTGGGTFYFSCATTDTLPRLAKMVVGEGSAKGMLGNADFFVQEENVIGGVFSPVYFGEVSEPVGKKSAVGASVSGGRFFYSAEFFRNSRLLTVPEEKINFVATALVRGEPVGDTEVAAEDAAENMSANLYTTKKYVPFKYYGGGIFLPVSLASTYSIDGYALETKQLLLGATFGTSNPWAGSIFIFSGGINPSPFEAVLSAQVTGGTETSFLQYAVSANAGFDKNGFVNTTEEASFDISVPFARYLQFIGGNDLLLFSGHSFAKNQNASEAQKTFDSVLTTPKLQLPWYLLAASPAENIFIAGNTFSAGLSTIHRVGGGRYESGGVSVELLYKIDYANSQKLSAPALLQNIGSVVTFKLPYILPVKNINRHTYNLPLEVSFSIFPQSDIFWQVASSMVLYSYEVQKALPFFTPLFVNTLSLFADYHGYLWASSAESWNITNTIEEFQKQSRGVSTYDSYLSLRLQALLSPNIGMLSKVIRGNFNAWILYYLGTQNLRNKFDFKVSFNFLF